MTGDINLDKEQLPSFLEAAATLKIRGLEHMFEETTKSTVAGIEKNHLEGREIKEPPKKKAKKSSLSPVKIHHQIEESKNQDQVEEQINDETEPYHRDASFTMEETEDSMYLEAEEISMVVLKEESFSDDDANDGLVLQMETEKTEDTSREIVESETSVTTASKEIMESEVVKVITGDQEIIEAATASMVVEVSVDEKENSLKSSVESNQGPSKGKYSNRNFEIVSSFNYFILNFC